MTGRPGPDSSGPDSSGTGFGARLSAAMRRRGRLCVGIDPHPGMLRAWGLPEDASGLREFGRRVISASL